MAPWMRRSFFLLVVFVDAPGVPGLTGVPTERLPRWRYDPARSCVDDRGKETSPRCFTESEARRRYSAQQIFFVVNHRGLLLLGGADGNHQRNEVILPRMCLARCWSGGPAKEPFLALTWRGLDKRRLKPIVEEFGNMSCAGSELPQVVIAEAAADDQDALAAQWRERAADGHVRGRIVTRFQGELDDGYVGVRIHDDQRSEGSVIEPLVRIESRRHACGLDERPDALRQLRRTRCRVLDMVGVLGEARIVVDHGRVWIRHHGELVGLPMAGDDEHGLRRNADL